MLKGLREEEENLYNLRRTDFAELDHLPLPDVPILFFVGGKFSAPPERQSKEFDHEAYFQHRIPQWINNWNQVIRNSTAGGWLIHCVNAGHMVHWDEPEIVLHNRDAGRSYKQVTILSHRVENSGTQARIHLVIAVVVNEGVRALFADALS